MRPIRRLYDFAGAFVMLAGLLQIPLFLLEGWGPRTQVMMALGVFWVILGLALRGRRRWLAWVCYFLTLLGIPATLVMMSTSSIGNWWWLLIALMHILAAYQLFRILWFDNARTQAPVKVTSSEDASEA